jgi:nitrile hydratase accessory protein
MMPAPDTSNFAAPWQAQIFALVVALEKDGHFAWSRFQALLTAAIGEAPVVEQGPDHYYRHWLAAADRLLSELGLIDAASLQQRMSKIAADRADSHQHDHHHHS